MRLLKKLLLLAVVAAVAIGALSAWQSPYWSLVQIDRGLDQRDLGLVERYADLEELVKASALVMAAMATEQVGAGGGDLGSSLLGALVGAMADKVGDAVAAPGAAELRRAVLDGRVSRSFGPFTVNEGWRALGPISSSGERAVAEIKGRCGEAEASLGLVFVSKDAGVLGADLGWPRKWVLVGVDAASVKALARSCRTR